MPKFVTRSSWRRPRGRFVVPSKAVPGAYVLSAASGSYTIVGSNVTLGVGRVLAAASGAYAVSGTAVSLRRGAAVVASSGSYAVSGTAAWLMATRTLPAAAGAYVVSGTAVGLRRGFTLAASSSAYVVAGSDVTLEYTPTAVQHYVLDAASGTYSITGSSVDLVRTVADIDVEQLGYWAHRHRGAKPIRLGSPDVPDRFEIVEDESVSVEACPAGVSMRMAVGRAVATGESHPLAGHASPAGVEMWLSVGQAVPASGGANVRAARGKKLSDADLAALLLEAA